MASLSLCRTTQAGATRRRKASSENACLPFVRIRGYLFGFYVSEPPEEPAHIHVKGKGGTAKLWLRPVRLGRSTYTSSETSEIVDIATHEEERFLEMWHERFGDR